jgi:hypothetical protein
MRKSARIQVDKDADKKLKVAQDPDFVNSPGFENSLAKVKSAHPEGIPDSDIVKYLCLKDKTELEEIHAAACLKLRQHLLS